ncbi:MAG TPA: FtsH protease activity modulator HflK [Candidatus Polarisedimenticolaceae bacterium]|nr:FtsH protease activity modulator HflK [Candidatus Polarisedimenticolaceae bacterium]
MAARDIRSVPPQQFRPPSVNFRLLALILAGMVVGALLYDMIYQIEPEAVGVVLTFGKFSQTTEPGLHLKLPWPIQSVTEVAVQRQLKQEFGFRTEEPGVRTRYAQGTFEGESLMLTGDLNVAVVEWTAQYRVDDPYRYLFRVRSITETFRHMNEAVMRAVVGDRSVTEVLTIGRQEIATEAERRLQELCDQYESGIHVEQIVLQDVNPPEGVRDSFNEVNESQQERERMINDARADFNRVIPKARGEAAQMLKIAEGYAADRVNRARGDAALFDSLRAAYARAPEVTRRRIYLETMETLLPKVKRKIVLDDDLEGLLPLLPLGGAEKGGQP